MIFVQEKAGLLGEMATVVGSRKLDDTLFEKKGSRKPDDTLFSDLKLRMNDGPTKTSINPFLLRTSHCNFNFNV